MILTIQGFPNYFVKDLLHRSKVGRKEEKSNPQIYIYNIDQL